MAEGLLDTNVFIHAHAHDSGSDECRRFLAALEQGHLRARLEPLVLHELSYALPHFVKQMTRTQVAEYLLMVLGWDGVQGDKDIMVDAVDRWGKSAGLSFVDAYLAALATQQGRPVYTKNVRELTGQGVSVPQPLPSGASGSQPSGRRSTR
jgi:predicted nucleic acid-binding protein